MKSASHPRDGKSASDVRASGRASSTVARGTSKTTAGSSVGKRRRPAVEALWAKIARNLLLVFVVAHHALLIGAAGGAIYWALWLTTYGRLDLVMGLRWAGAAICLAIAALALARLWSAMRGLVTASHDAADEDVHGTKLMAKQHPALVEVVSEVARRVGAPAPDEIWISADARCFAFEQRGFAVTTQRTLVLVLGLPHLLVLTAAELRLIVGHELAHFRQNDTTLAVFIFRFSQSLQTYLERSRRSWLGWINPVAWIEWASFGVLRLLIAPVQRWQEIRADCRSAEVFGGDLARRTLLKDWLVTSRFTALVEQWMEDSALGKEHRWKSVHQEFLDQWWEVSPSGKEYLRQRLDELEEESYWDSHPALSNRLRAVAAYPNFGIEDLRPAISLLGDKQALLKELGDELAAELQIPGPQPAVAG